MKTQNAARWSVIAATLGLAATAGAQVPLRTIVLSGEEFAPGLSIDQFAGTGPVLNSAGEVAFGVIGFGGGAEAAAILGFDIASGRSNLLVGPDAQGPSSRFLSFDFYSLSDDGRLATEAVFVRDGAVASGYFTSPIGGSLSPQAVFGDGVGFDFVATAATATSGGTFAIGGFLPNVPFDEAGSIIAGTPGGPIVEVARQGSQVPGLPDGVRYENTGPVSVNSSGQVLFSTILRGDVSLLVDDSAVIMADARGVEPTRVLARAGGAALGLAGSSIIQVGSPSLNNAGDVIYSAVIAPTGSDPFDPGTTLGTALYATRDSGATRLVTASGQLAAGYDDGTTILDVAGGRITSSGHIGYIARVSSQDLSLGLFDSAVFFDRDGATSRLAYTGQRVESLGEEFFIADLFGERPTVNDRGQAILGATIFGATLGQSFFGLLGVDTDGSLMTIVYEGQLIEVSPGDFREVALILGGGSAIEDGGSRTFNDNGQFVFSVVFTDFSQGHFATVVPSAPSLLVALAVGPWAARRRRLPR